MNIYHSSPETAAMARSPPIATHSKCHPCYTLTKGKLTHRFLFFLRITTSILLVLKQCLYILTFSIPKQDLSFTSFLFIWN